MSIFSRIFKRKPTIVTPRKPYGEMQLVIRPDKILEVKLICKSFDANRERYAVVSKLTGVPEDVLFACHYRESSLSFKGILHNGEEIIGTRKKTKLVPAGRGPFKSWEEAAIDAMEIEQRKFPKTWDLVGKLEFCEAYNGIGYKNHGIPSPYVLSFTNEYSAGKYTSDGVLNYNVVDKQCGTAAIILELGYEKVGG